MKSRFNTAFIALSGAVLLAVPAMGAVSLENGSLAIAFYQVTAGPGGGTVGPNTYVFDLGQASLYRENTAYNVSVSTVNSGLGSSNISADLVTAFGANWATSGTVRWMIVGNVAQGTPTVGGDPSRTSYFSVGANDPSTPSTFPDITSPGRIQASNQITPFFSGTQNEISGVNADGTIIAKTDLFSVDEYVNPTTSGLWFSLGTDITQTLGSSSYGVGLSGALDIYRVLHTTSGADLSAGYSQNDAVTGTGQYVGTITLDSAGNLSVVPEPSSALLGLAGAFGLCLRRRRGA